MFYEALLMSTHNIQFHGEIRKISLLLGCLIKGYFIIFFFIFIDHKSRITQKDSFEFHFFITGL